MKILKIGGPGLPYIGPGESFGAVRVKPEDRNGVQTHTFLTYCDGPNKGKETRAEKGQEFIFDHVLNAQQYVDNGLASVEERADPEAKPQPIAEPSPFYRKVAAHPAEIKK